MKKVEQTKCGECGSTRFEKIVEADTHVVAGTRYVVEIPAMKCLKCEDVTIAGPIMQRAERLVAAQVARRGPATGETLRFMRRVLGLKSGELAQLLGIRAETLSRWEKDVDRQPERTAWATVAAMVAESLKGQRETLDRLDALENGAKIPKVVRVDAAAEAT